MIPISLMKEIGIMPLKADPAVFEPRGLVGWFELLLFEFWF